MSAPMVGIQIGSVSFVDEGTEQVLDILQERARVNTLFLVTFSFSRAVAGRQLPGRPMPDHGKQEYDRDFHGGHFATPHPEYYRDTALKPFRAPDHGDLDILASVLPEAKKRGMKAVCWILDDGMRPSVPNIARVQERDLYGRNKTTLCLNHPDYINFLLGLYEDFGRSYDVDGIMWGSERQGALGQTLGAWDLGKGTDPGKAGCFCEFCRKKAAARGIDFDRACAGFRELERFVKAGQAAARPVDGYFVEFWRILLRYPEIAAWEHLWHDSLRDLMQLLYRRAKAVRSQLMVGWHIWHNNTFNPVYRAEQDVAALTPYSDYIKVVMYNNCAGERMAAYLDSVGQNLFADMSRQEALDFEYRVMNFNERSFARIPFTGFSADYVARETKRALAAVAGTKTLILPGIDIDIPSHFDAPNHSLCTPLSTKAATLAALRAGTPGVLLSRKYSEMRLANLGGAGEAIKEVGSAA